MGHRAHANLYNAKLDALTESFAGCTMRFYTGAQPGTFGTTPSGTVIAEIVIPTPSHAASAFISGSNLYRAVLAGNWQDAAANASGTIQSFAIFDGSTIIWDGNAGTAAGSDIVLSQAAVTVGAVFSIVAFTINEPPMA